MLGRYIINLIYTFWEFPEASAGMMSQKRRFLLKVLMTKMLINDENT